MTRKRNLAIAVVSGCILLMASSCKPSDDQILKTVTNVATAVAPRVTVKVLNGVVTLNGVIPDSLTKLDLDTAILKMKGIVALHDEAAILPLADSVKAHDKIIAHTIDSAFHANNIAGITVSVYNGIITLSGNTTAADFKKIQQVVDNVHPRKVLNGLNIQ